MAKKDSTSTSTVSIPPEVLARYNAANSLGSYAAGVTYGTNQDGTPNYNEVTGMKPFQLYGGQFVAPVNNVEQGGIDQINNWYRDMAQNYVGGAQNDVANSYQNAQGYTAPAIGYASNGYNAAQGLYNGSITTGQTGVAQGSGLMNSGVATMNQAANQAGGLYGSSDTNYLVAANEGQQGLAEAKPWINNAYGTAAPVMGQAQGLLSTAVGAGQNYANQASGFMGGATGAVNPNQIDQTEINRYMTPYLNNVVQSQMGLLNQQNEQQRAALRGNAVASGAWGSDRAGIAEANLGQQQSLSNAQIISGLLNQGYNNALGTAQQQQGVNLSAQQANRQAQQFGEQASAALGQQQYNQALGASNAYQQLGQGLFNMNLGQGQALANLGQQAYNMRLGVAQGEQGLGSAQGALGAQQAGTQLNAGQGLNSMYSGLAGQQQSAANGLFNSGVGLGNFYNTTGQQVFNQGQQAGANWLNIGMQAQNAGLTGSQAAIQAGQVAQQTQQAQDTAQYNQFLQQQGYPFQVAQFLANIAEGTGSLSGSTTTTTQPAPWWSDERLKTDKVRIGKADDGTPIYKYRYKNDPSNQPHIGLMAQDVEKKHPEAVGLVGGYKTLDYDKLPGREERAMGGTTVSQTVGYDPSQGGLIGGDSFAPYKGGLGKTGYVPAPTVPVGQLKVAQPPSNQQTNQLKGLIDTGKTALSLGKDVKSGYDWLTNKASGGLVRGYDAGGDVDVEPYGDDVSEGYMTPAMKGMKQPRKLATANSSGGSNQSNPLSDISSAVGTAKNIYGLGSGLMSFLPSLAFLKTGGLVRGYDDGGDVIPAPDTGDDQSVKPAPDTLDRILKGIGQVESGHNYGITGPATRDGDRAYGAYQVMGKNIGPWSKEALGRELTPQEFLADPEAQHAIAKHKVSQYYNQYQNPDDVASMWFSGRPAAGNNRSDTYNTVPQYLSKFRAAMGQNPDAPAADAVQASADFAPPTARTGLVPQKAQDSSESSGIMGNIGNLLSGNGWKGDGDNRFLLSVLQGLGTMASSNSRYLGASILQGIGGGAKAYSDLTKQQADIAKESLGMAGQIFTRLPNGNYYNSLSGEELLPQQYAQQLGRLPGMSTFMPRVSGGTDQQQPIPGATAPTAPTTQPTQATSPGTNQGQQTKPGQQPASSPEQAVIQSVAPGHKDMNMDVFANATDETNPNYYAQRIAQARADQAYMRDAVQKHGYDPQKAREQIMLDNQVINDSSSQITKIMKGEVPVQTIGPDGKRIFNDPANQYIKTYNNNLAAKQKFATETEPAMQKDMYEKYNQFYSEVAPQLEQSLDAVTRMSTTTDTNKASVLWADGIGYMRSIPWIRDNMGDTFARLQSAVETQNKSAIKEAFQDVQKGLQRAPSAALRAAMQAVANPDMSPGARYNLITQAKANLYRDYDYYNGWDPNGNMSVGEYNKQFQNDKNHNVAAEYTKKAIASTPYFAGMKDGEKQQLGYIRNDDGTVTPTRVGANVRNNENAGRAGTSAPAGPQTPMPKIAAPGPAVPKALQGRQLQFSPSRQMYRDPRTGEMFDMKGNKVK